MAADFLHPTDECDLVMKGGITSGIVYPPVVLKLAAKDPNPPEAPHRSEGRSYRFRNIGGTSAGAIAAAVTAAAEYGRETGGFETLQEVNDQLSQGTFLRDLFQPSTKIKPLFDTLSALFIDSKTPKEQSSTAKPNQNQFLKLLQILQRNNLKTFAKGSSQGLLLGVLLALAFSGISFLVFFLFDGSFNWQGFFVVLLLFGLLFGGLGWFLGGLANSLYHLWNILTKELPKSNFGMCSGMGGENVLTQWLSAKINQAAGKSPKDQPLTFGELSKKKIDDKDASINLKMVTSNLSHNQPYDLPFKNHLFVFKEDEFYQLFPAHIVDFMKQLKHPDKNYELPEGFYFLPEADDLPVAVAMRMSLSFPVLISAVPLWTISQAAYNHQQTQTTVKLNPEDLQKNLFSDGGISSNFPIHFFDVWLPSRPTFGINLTSLPSEALTKTETNSKTKIQVNPTYLSIPVQPAKLKFTSTDANMDTLSKAVYIPKADEFLQPEWVEIRSLFNFIGAIFSTAQNYRDNTQSMLPSYRERVVQVRLSHDEGGLNLTMPENTIEAVKKKGEKAGEKILKYFKLEHHQWVRFQVLMAVLEDQLEKMETVLRDKKLDYEKLVEDQHNESQKYPYPRQAEWCKKALCRVEKMRKLIKEDWSKPLIFKDDDTPLPEPVLRVMPDL